MLFGAIFGETAATFWEIFEENWKNELHEQKDENLQNIFLKFPSNQAFNKNSIFELFGSQWYFFSIFGFEKSLFYKKLEHKVQKYHRWYFAQVSS